MVSSKAVVRMTASFEAHLEAIADFWRDRGAPHAYDHLLQELGDTVFSNLENHPRMGRRFFVRAGQSLQARQRLAAMQKRFGDAEVREYLSGDYLLLYSVVNASTRGKRPAAVTIDLLAIRHHRQLSFEFDAFWQANRSEDF